VEAISHCGATPVFVDIDETSYTMNPEKLEEAITKRTKAVIPVHLYGQTADMAPIMEIARRHGLYVIEDACQAHGAEYHGKRAGSMGDAGCFSFYPGKNLGAYGEAGGVVTNNPDLAVKIKTLRDHGQSRKYHHEVVGVNSRMDGLQGAILGAKLRHLPEWNEARREKAEIYREQLQGIDGVTLPVEMDYARHVYHIFALRVRNRDALMAALSEKGIGCSVHYPVPVHLQDAYRSMKLRKGSFPVAEKCAEEVVSLPMFAELSDDQIEYVVYMVRQFYRYSRQFAAVEPAQSHSFAGAC
jgi:dTDP-4-amino-4,6-dideoxygalactose transaminase